ncbi:MAG: 6,7-dimethyl-8-ribityllumazine synthase [Gammaproteobacteria bacterium]|jgi:6,7-dimethyl-8-ribityllumazine synthase|nr:6,7-dimethyl-8-ribityllumazine synthase [Gammaproteobacteria bacterium]
MEAGSKTFVGEQSGRGLRIGLAVARFNEFITESLLGGAKDALGRNGLRPADIEVVRVPGAWELPLAIRYMIDSGRYDGIVALGAVIRGATPHFEYVAGECSRQLADLSLHNGIPVGFGVLTVDTIEQAIERAGTKAGNKGAEAALTVIEMINLGKALKG